MQLYCNSICAFIACNPNKHLYYCSAVLAGSFSIGNYWCAMQVMHWCIVQLFLCIYEACHRIVYYLMFGFLQVPTCYCEHWLPVSKALHVQGSQTTWKSGKTWKMVCTFPVRGKLEFHWNSQNQGKVQEFLFCKSLTKSKCLRLKICTKCDGFSVDDGRWCSI